MTGTTSIGQTIGGKYVIERLLGEGGMGRVMLARHTLTKRRVALKFLREEFAHNPDMSARFLSEARAAVQMESEHVARVQDVDVLPSGAPYMVMEYLEGEDLAAVVVREHRLSTERAVDCVLEACVAVAEAHALGIVHRDLKPANLFLARRKDGSIIVKVLDFGIAKALAPQPGSTSVAATRAGGVMGSPPYMSPEQLTAPQLVDVRTDIWALGIVLYELVTGAVPFRGDPISVQIIQVVQSPHEPLSNHLPGVAAVLSAVVDRCLRKDQNRRFANVADFAEALVPLASPVGVAAAKKVRAMHATAARPELASGASFPSQTPDEVADSAPTLMYTGPSTTGARWESPAASSTVSQATLQGGRGLAAACAVAVLGAAAVGALLLRRPSVIAATQPASAPEQPSSAAAAPEPPPTTSGPVLSPVTALDANALPDATPPKPPVAGKLPAKAPPNPYKDPPKPKKSNPWGGQH